MEEFISHCYIYKGHGAIKHLFKVACGLDSQILGELEISGQLKGAFQKAYENEMVNTFTERLIQYVNHSSKEIKTKTALNSGTASVSRAAVQYLRNRVENLPANRVLMLGAGEIGRNTCDNLLKYVRSEQVTVINRTLQRAKTFAATYQCQYDHYENRHRYIKESDVIIVATGARHSALTPEDFESAGDRKHTFILDLSVPRNVSSSLTRHPGIDLTTTDKLQEQNEEVLKTREESVPKALEIIEYHIKLFFNWLNTNSLSPVFSGFQYYLNFIKQKEMEKYMNKITKNQYHC
jgi:glutamyl-tRNA reductase